MTSSSCQDVRKATSDKHVLHAETWTWTFCRLFVVFLLQSLLANGPSSPQNKYMKLENEIEKSNQHFIEDTQGQQQVGPRARTKLSPAVGVGWGRGRRWGSWVHFNFPLELTVRIRK